MPATRHQLHRVGFSPEQSEQLVKINDTTTTVTFTARSTVRVAAAAGATVLSLNDTAGIAAGDEVVIARGTGVEETRAVTAVEGIVARTAVRTATAAGATVLPVDDATGIVAGDIVVIARGTAVEETRTVTAVDMTALANTITVAALTNAHAVGEAVDEAVHTITVAALTNAHAAGEAVDERTSTTVASPPSTKALLRAGFTDDQARILRTPGRTRVQLIRQAKMTRAQATLVLAP